jgi:hypothetical protein
VDKWRSEQLDRRLHPLLDLAQSEFDFRSHTKTRGLRKNSKIGVVVVMLRGEESTIELS